MSQERKQKVDARALITKLSKEGNAVQQREIIAPLLPDGKIRTRLNGMVYEFRPKEPFVGWGRFRPVNGREAEVLGEALPWERGSYLELFPALRMILLWPDPDPKRVGTWWALPFNESDARQRFGMNAEPLPVFLCDPTNGAERFERIIARVDGKMLWFEGADLLADPTHAEWLRDATAQPETVEQFLPGLAGSERMTLIFWQIRQMEIAMEPVRRQREENERHRIEVERERRAERERVRLHEARQRDHVQRQMEAQLERPRVVPQHNRNQQRDWLREQRLHSQMENRLQHALAKANAVLHSYSEIPTRDGSPGQIMVEWSERGHRYRYRSTVNLDLTVVSSGICLSGRDRDFDLTSLVRVMTDSPWAYEE